MRKLMVLSLMILLVIGWQVQAQEQNEANTVETENLTTGQIEVNNVEDGLRRARSGWIILQDSVDNANDTAKQGIINLFARIDTLREQEKYSLTALQDSLDKKIAAIDIISLWQRIVGGIAILSIIMLVAILIIILKKKKSTKDPNGDDERGEIGDQLKSLQENIENMKAEITGGATIGDKDPVPLGLKNRLVELKDLLDGITGKLGELQQSLTSQGGTGTSIPIQDMSQLFSDYQKETFTTLLEEIQTSPYIEEEQIKHLKKLLKELLLTLLNRMDEIGTGEIPKPNPMEELVASFQRLLYYEKDYEDFCNRYKLTTFGVENINARSRKPDLAPIFACNIQGATYAVKLPGQKSEFIYVLPILQKKYSATQHHTNCWKYLFDTEPVYEKGAYRRIELIRPAKLRLKHGKTNEYEVVEKGLLRISNPA